MWKTTYSQQRDGVIKAIALNDSTEWNETRLCPLPKPDIHHSPSPMVKLFQLIFHLQMNSSVMYVHNKMKCVNPSCGFLSAAEPSYHTEVPLSLGEEACKENGTYQ